MRVASFRLFRFIACFALPLLQAQVRAQTGVNAPTFTVTARLIVLDVVVTDKNGNLVERTLGKDDFQIYENGVRQTIRSFEGPDAHRLPAASNGAGAIVNSAADLPKIGNAPVTILVLDELNSRFEDMSYARQMMVRYLQTQPAVLTTPTVLMVASNTTFQQLHDYTQDRDALIQIVKKHMPEVPYKAGAGGPAAVERMAQVLSALQQLTEASTGTIGRKNLIWVGNGFPSANLVGLDQKTTDALEAAIRRVTSRLLAARITVYTVNPEPGSSATVKIDTPDDLALATDELGGDPFDSGTISFSNLATSTGGIAYRGRNDIENIIREGIDKGNDYYTISYSPTAIAEGVDPAKYRVVKIVMSDPDLRATTREGYFPATAADLNPVVDKSMSDKQVAANLKLDLSQALTSTISYNGLTVTATKSDGGNYQLDVAEKGIGWSPPTADGLSNAEATVAAAWYGRGNKVLGHVAREETYPRDEVSQGAKYTLQVTIPADAVRVRFVVRDARNGHMGTVDLTF